MSETTLGSRALMPASAARLNSPMSSPSPWGHRAGTVVKDVCTPPAAVATTGKLPGEMPQGWRIVVSPTATRMPEGWEIILSPESMLRPQSPRYRMAVKCESMLSPSIEDRFLASMVSQAAQCVTSPSIEERLLDSLAREMVLPPPALGRAYDAEHGAQSVSPPSGDARCGRSAVNGLAAALSPSIEERLLDSLANEMPQRDMVEKTRHVSGCRCCSRSPTLSTGAASDRGAEHDDNSDARLSFAEQQLSTLASCW